MARLRVVTLALVVGVMASLIAGPASARTTHEEIPFDRQHECTREDVSGDARVTLWMDETDNGDGTTTVTVRQHVHGSDLRGVVSGDKYVINERSETVETFTIFGNAGTVTVRTTFIHYTERQAFAEVPGEDDLHQYTEITFSPLLPPMITDQTTDCR